MPKVVAGDYNWDYRRNWSRLTAMALVTPLLAQIANDSTHSVYKESPMKWFVSCVGTLMGATTG